MKSAAALIAMASAAMILSAGTPASATTPAAEGAQARTAGAPVTWGPYYSPGGKRAKASGKITPTGENHEVIPSAATLTVSGKVSDLSRSSSCGWAVFNIATVNAAGNRVTWKPRHVRTCAYRTPKTFSFTYHRVYQVELKVCAERRASKPSIQCIAGNPAWKSLYISPN